MGLGFVETAFGDAGLAAGVAFFLGEEAVADRATRYGSDGLDDVRWIRSFFNAGPANST